MSGLPSTLGAGRGAASSGRPSTLGARRGAASSGRPFTLGAGRGAASSGRPSTLGAGRGAASSGRPFTLGARRGAASSGRPFTLGARLTTSGALLKTFGALRVTFGALLITLGALPGASAAEPARGAWFEWRAPDECPSRAEVVAEISAQVGRDVESPPPAGLSVVAEVREVGARVAVEVQLRSGAGVQSRRLEAETCEALALAVSVIVSLSLGHELAPPQTKTATEAARRPLRPATPRAEISGPSTPWALGVELGVESGGLPSPALALGLWAGPRFSAARLDLGVVFRPERSSVSTGAAPGGRFWQAGGFARVCVEVLDAPAASAGLGVCGGLEAGAVRGVGVGVGQPARVTAPWFSTFAEVRLAVSPFDSSASPGEGVRLVARARGAMAQVRPRFEIEGVGTVFELDRVSLQAGLGLELFFF